MKVNSMPCTGLKERRSGRIRKQCKGLKLERVLCASGAKRRLQGRWRGGQRPD